MILIQELYTPKAVRLIRELYYDDMDARHSFYHAFGDKIIQSQEKILISDPLNILMFMCCTAKFSSSEEESQQVAIIINKRIREANPLPYILDDQGIDLAEKCLISLSFFYPAMAKRHKKGAPSPEFYRNISASVFKANGYTDLAEHHKQWEQFLIEFFV